MLFKNNKENAEKVRIEEGAGKRKGFKWVTVKPGDEIELAKDYGLNMGFTLIGDSQAEEAPEDEGNESDEDGEDEVSFEEELQALDGVGKKTVEDIVKVYPDKASLLKAVQDNVEMPFRDDVVGKLKDMFSAEKALEDEEKKEE